MVTDYNLCSSDKVGQHNYTMYTLQLYGTNMSITYAGLSIFFGQGDPRSSIQQQCSLRE